MRPRPGAQEEAARPNRIARGSKIAAVFAKHGLRELFGYPDVEGAIGRRRQAKRLRSALEELGPTFAKIGQMLSTRPDLLPPEFIDELAQLQDSVAPLTEEQVVRVMEQDLGVPWEDVFETIDREPLAAGTIAQVHRASLAGGDNVVVKIQRPEAKDVIVEDLALLKLFAEKAGARPGVRRLIDMPAVFEHLSVSLYRELDFRREASNAERMRGALADFPRLAVPRIYNDFSTSRLLVMQDVAGVPAADVPMGKVRKETATQLLESFCKQILIDGFFHADPHPGNLMWQPEEELLYFLDLGMVGEVSAEMREHMMLLLMAFWQKDAGFLSDVILMLSGETNRREPDIEAFRRDMQAFMAKYRSGSVKDLQFGTVLQEMIEVSFRHGVPLPASLTLTAKTLAQMQQVASQLDPDIDPFDVAGRFLMRSLMREMVAKSDAQSALLSIAEDEGPGHAFLRGSRAVGRRASRPEARCELPRYVSRGNCASRRPPAYPGTHGGLRRARKRAHGDFRARGRLGISDLWACGRRIHGGPCDRPFAQRQNAGSRESNKRRRLVGGERRTWPR